MCGINGFVLQSINEQEAMNKLERMNALIHHRGPDQNGFFVKSLENCILGFAMQRLSIIDLSSGKQPISSTDGNYTIVFNGEIYNYRVLKQQLLDLGYQFQTKSDTEVILNLYIHYGVDAFSMLDGMFAFSIYDKIRNKVFIARDYFGEKPLYYSQTDEGVYWGSELKSIVNRLSRKPEISKQGLNLYFQLTYIPAPFTIYEGISKLEANNYLEINLGNISLSIHTIKESVHEDYSQLSKADAVKVNHDLVQESVLSRSESEVPLGTFLSGGVDSSIVSLCLAQQTNKKIDTFSIGFDKKEFDESEKATTVANLIGSNHHKFIISEKDLMQDVDRILLNFDEPFADSSALPTFLVALKTRQKVTVALTGDGGDEVYGGYNKYYMGKLNQKYTSIVPESVNNWIKTGVSKFVVNKDDQRGFAFKLNRLMNAMNYEGDYYYNIISLAFQKNELESLLHSKFQYTDALNYYKAKINKENLGLTEFRNIDRMLSLEGDMLVKVDRTTMLSSLESRAPFLNKKLWDFTSQLSENYLLKGFDKKHLLKESFKQYFPEKFLDKSKKGFGVPVGDWLRGFLKPELLRYVETDFLLKQDLFNVTYIQDLVSNHLSGKRDNTFRAWTFYCFQKWYYETYDN
ncbi:asparagine synthase (glutamine-hydrolyzing) [Flavobacterium sp.]|uniref:asparagine synthase (glutamine-hydrolyzing) n=1 Tax=Flavobacterium sp. TaxID=239 RepID=UPI003D10F0AD